MNRWLLPTDLPELRLVTQPIMQALRTHPDHRPHAGGLCAELMKKEDGWLEWKLEDACITEFQGANFAHEKHHVEGNPG